MSDMRWPTQAMNCLPQAWQVGCPSNFIQNKIINSNEARVDHPEKETAPVPERDRESLTLTVSVFPSNRFKTLTLSHGRKILPGKRAANTLKLLLHEKSRRGEKQLRNSSKSKLHTSRGAPHLSKYHLQSGNS